MCHLSSPASSTGLETAMQRIQSPLKQVTYGGWNTLEVSLVDPSDLSRYVDSINAERPKYHHIRGRRCDAARVGPFPIHTSYQRLWWGETLTHGVPPELTSTAHGVHDCSFQTSKPCQTSGKRGVSVVLPGANISYTKEILPPEVGASLGWVAGTKGLASIPLLLWSHPRKNVESCSRVADPTKPRRPEFLFLHQKESKRHPHHPVRQRD